MILLKKYWKQITIVILLIMVGVLLTLMFRRSPGLDTTGTAMFFKAKVDSLQKANLRSNQFYQKKSDSIDKIVKAKEQVNTILNLRIEDITNKYIALRNSEPDHDTVVSRDTLYAGRECIEKYRILEAQLVNMVYMTQDLNHKIAFKDQQIDTLQAQFSASLGINKQQEKELKKVQRKLKWTKIANYSGAIIGVGLLTLLILKK